VTKHDSLNANDSQPRESLLERYFRGVMVSKSNGHRTRASACGANRALGRPFIIIPLLHDKIGRGHSIGIASAFNWIGESPYSDPAVVTIVHKHAILFNASSADNQAACRGMIPQHERVHCGTAPDIGRAGRMGANYCYQLRYTYNYKLHRYKCHRYTTNWYRVRAFNVWAFRLQRRRQLKRCPRLPTVSMLTFVTA